MVNKNSGFRILSNESFGRNLESLLIVFTLFLLCCTPPGKDNSTKFTQYYLQGEQLYIKHCSNCHQPNGTGLGRVYPPLYQSDFMDKNFEKVICSIKYGIKGEMIVNGNDFNQEMPGVPSLTDLEIAEIATYIYNTWEHKRGLVDVKATSQLLEKCRAK